MELASSSRIATVIAATFAPLIFASFAACGSSGDDGGGTSNGGAAPSSSSRASSSSSSKSTASSSKASSSSSASSGGAGGAGGAGGGGGAEMDAGDAGDASLATTSSSGGGGAGGDGGCVMDLETFPLDSSPHVPECTYVAYSTNPPTSGPHYPIWAEYKTYTTAIPRGNWVHDMEHGGVVFTYNCPSGCDAEVQAYEAFVASLTPDPECTPPDTVRYSITPDPYLDVKFAVSAWGTYLKGDCFDLAAIESFFAANYGHGPEDFCTDLDFDPSSPDAGLPEGCGDPPSDASTD